MEFQAAAGDEGRSLRASRGAIASIYSSWRQDFDEWAGTFDFLRGPSPVLLCVADNAERARWLFEHLTHDCELTSNCRTRSTSSSTNAASCSVSTRARGSWPRRWRTRCR